MKKKWFNLTYLILLILNQILIINVEAFKNPEIREKHTVTLINNKLYILGGKFINAVNLQKEFFYFDVSSPFDTTGILEWQEPTIVNGKLPPPHFGATTIAGGINNDEIILFGGQLQQSKTPETQSSIYVYNTKENSWNIPTIAGGTVIPRNFVNAVSDGKGKMYIFGGFEEFDKFYDTMDIFDTINFSWSKGSNVNAPSKRHSYSATLLPNAQILYIGGFSNFYGIEVESSFIDGSTVYLYDTVNDSWDLKTTRGFIPDGMHSHSAVLAYDKLKVIVYGGTRKSSSDPKIFVLSLVDYSWSVPRVSGGNPKMRTGHTATAIGKYMLITFGFNSEKDLNGQITTLDPGDKELMILDISDNEDYYWVNSFIPPEEVPNNPGSNSTSSNPKSPSNPETTNSQIPGNPTNNNKKRNKTVIIVVNSILGTLLGIMGIAGIFFIRYRKKKSAKPFPGDEKVLPNDNHGQEILQVDQDDDKDILKISNDREILQITGENNDERILQIASDKDSEKEILRITSENNDERILQIASDSDKDERKILRIAGDENNNILQIASDQEMQNHRRQKILQIEGNSNTSVEKQIK